MFAKLWKDEAGFTYTMEVLFVATIMVIGLVTGWTAAENALKVELFELGNAILALSQEYGVSGQSFCKAYSEGTLAIDNPGFQSFILTPGTPSVIDVETCPAP